MPRRRKRASLVKSVLTCGAALVQLFALLEALIILCLKVLKIFESSICEKIASEPRSLLNSDPSVTYSSLNLLQMDAFEFEHLIARLLRHEGFETTVTKASGDGGIDCIAINRSPLVGAKIVVQAKRYSGTVGVATVRELYGVVQHEGANKGIVVTTGKFSETAETFAQGKPLELIDGIALRRELRKIGIEAVYD